MRSPANPFLLTLAWLALCPSLCDAHLHYQIMGEEPGAWPQVLQSIGLRELPAQGSVYSSSQTLWVVRAGSEANAAAWQERVAKGALLVLEGYSPLAESFGIKASAKAIAVRNVRDVHAEDLPLIWERSLEVARPQLPGDAEVFTRERWEQVPLVAGLRRGKGAVLWVASALGKQGYERYPYLLHSLTDLGLQAPFQSRRLWAFFDSSYRSRADLDYLAERWRASGIAVLHVAAWHYQEPDAQRDAYLQKLMEACHKRAILVYAWLELPHVSEAFWQAHPEWREKTALQQDAHLDWRKLMNLTNRDCFREAARGVHSLIDRFDWDGINLAELYFESLEGAANPARFTPLNADVRGQFQAQQGFDPLALFDANSPHHASKQPEGLTAFLSFRASLADRMQREWMAEMQQARRRKPHLDLALTHVDDRFDTRMRDLIGADAARLLPMLEQQDFTFLVEDPATVWHLGPERYEQIASRYQPLTPRKDKLAIDINIVERYQDVYPSKQQTGTELFQLVQTASRSFPRVALYFERSLLRADQPLLAAASAVVPRAEFVGRKLVVESPQGVGVPFSGVPLVDGRPWPFTDGRLVWMPPGTHTLEASTAKPVELPRLLDFNGTLQTISVNAQGFVLSYTSGARAIAILEQEPARVQLDGFAAQLPMLPTPQGVALLLPRGQHIVEIQPALRQAAAR